MIFIYFTLGFGTPQQAFSSFLPAFKLASFWLAVTHNQDFCGLIWTLIDVLQRQEYKNCLTLSFWLMGLHALHYWKTKCEKA